MKNILRVIASLLLILATAGCLIPEKFTAKIIFNNDGGYTYSYDGTFAFALALAAVKDGKLSTADELALKREEEKIRKEPGFKSVSYAGNGRYDVKYELHRKAGEPTFFVSKDMSFFSIIPKQDGSIEVKGLSLSKNDIAQLSSIGSKIDGVLKIEVGKGYDVVKHNASVTPKFFNLVGNYEWSIRNPSEAPFMLIRPSSK